MNHELTVTAGDTLEPTSASLCTRDVLRPITVIKLKASKLSRHRIALSGIGSDLACKAKVNAVTSNVAGTVTRVDVSIARLTSHGRCHYVNRHGRLGRAGKCRRARVFLTARGTSVWKLLRRGVNLRAGTYQVFARARDGAGRVDLPRKGVNVMRFRIR